MLADGEQRAYYNLSLEGTFTMSALPTNLEREPLIDAVFEIRLSGEPQTADILPGALYNLLSPRPTLTRLPAAEIPQPIRKNDPNLNFAPLTRLDWDRYYILIGDHAITVGCTLPYPKWNNFKSAILEIMKKIGDAGISAVVERYSTKYTNIIPAEGVSEQLSKVNINLSIAGTRIGDSHVNIQLQQFDGDILHLITVVTGASVKSLQATRMKELWLT